MNEFMENFEEFLEGKCNISDKKFLINQTLKFLGSLLCKTSDPLLPSLKDFILFQSGRSFEAPSSGLTCSQ